jgi:glycosyltransferase involved in cell wall biosynthesis
MTVGRENISNRKPGRVAYILRAYPRLSETFIVQEVLQMEARGAQLAIFAFKDPGETMHNPAEALVQAPVYYLQPTTILGWLKIVPEHIRLIFTAPLRYLQTLVLVFQSVIAGGRFRPFFLAAQLTRQIRSLGIEHVHAHFANKPTALARYASVLTGIPFSFTAHAKDLYLSTPDSIAGKAVRASFITTCTEYNADYLRGILLPGDRAKVHTVYHGVDTDRFKFRQTETSRATPTIVSVGRLVPKKGHRNVVQAAQLLRDRGYDFRLDIYGQGDLREPLRRQIEASGIGSMVHLHGARTQDELIQVYRKADVFVLAPVVTPNGDRDGIPNVLLEAMATGLSVVSTTISGIPEVIQHGVNGLLVPSEDPEAVADALAALLDDPDLRESLGTNAAQSVRARFDAATNAEYMAYLLGFERTDRAHRVRSG